MEFIVYIQSEKGFPVCDWALSAYMGFIEKGTRVILFEEIQEVPNSPYNIVVAWIEDTLKHFKRLNVPYIGSLNVPHELTRFLGRNIEYMSMGDFMNDKREPVFVKPAGIAKAFPSGIIKNVSNKSFILHGVPLDTPTMVSEIVDIVSEYRAYIIRKELKGIKHYQGDFRIFPNMKIVDEAIEAYTNAPDGYAMDFGITNDGKTILIECNDGWSLGNYGLEPRIYSNLIAARWIQIMGMRK